MSDDLREAIETAMDTDTAATEAPVDTPVDTPVADAALEPVESDGKVRDSLGRFVPKAEASDTPAAAPATAPATPPSVAAPQADLVAPQVGAAPSVAPPQSWAFGAKEHWAALPPVVQEQVARREADMARFVTETAIARQLGERFYQTVQPFMPAIQAEGVDPLTAVTNLMQFGARMRMGTPAEKASTVAQIVKAYGVDIEALDSALVGAPMPAQAQGVDPGYVQNAVQQALAPLMQAAQQRQQAMAQANEARIASELQTFAADPKNRYFSELRSDMADIIDVAERQGREMSLADAYYRAAMLHPEISKVMMSERQGVNAHQLTQAAQRAKAAAVSVKGAAPVGNPAGPEPSSIRESIEAAIEATSRY